MKIQVSKKASMVSLRATHLNAMLKTVELKRRLVVYRVINEVKNVVYALPNRSWLSDSQPDRLHLTEISMRYGKSIKKNVSKIEE